MIKLLTIFAQTPDKVIDWTTAVSMLLTTIAAIVAAYHAWRSNKRTEKLEKKVDIAGADILRVEKATNSMKDQLVAAASSEGNLQGRADERARADEERKR